MKAFIKDIAIYYPSITITNEDLVAMGCKWSSEQIRSKIGINSRKFCSEEESSLTLGLEAARQLLLQNKDVADKIDYILFSTLNHDHFMMNSAAYIQKALNLPKSVAAVDFKLGCSGYITLLTIAKALIESEIAQNILVITADTYSKVLSEDDFSTMTVFGDAATASLISKEGKYEITKLSHGTDGTGSHIHAKRIGICNNNDIDYIYDVEQKAPDKFYMVGEEIFDFVSSTIPEFIEPIMKAENCITEKDNLYLFHQANQYMLNYLRKKLMIPKEQFYIDMENNGNTSTSSIPIALNKIFKGTLPKKIICCSFGGGYCWNALILEQK